MKFDEFLQFQLFPLFRQTVQGRNVQNAPVSKQPGRNAPLPATDEPQVSSSRYPLADGFAVGFVKMGTIDFSGMMRQVCPSYIR